MTSKLKQKLVAVHEEHVAEEISEQRAAQQNGRRDSLLMVVGGARAIHAVVEALNAQTIRALQRIRDEEFYTADGFTRFDEFLDKSSISPMSYAKFNRLEKALLTEGDELFNYLNAINAPMAKRRLLGKGTLAIEGEEIVLRHDEDEQRISLSDRATLLTTLSKLADQANEQSRTIARGKKDVDKWKRKADEASANGRPDATPYETALDDAIAAIVKLTAEAEQLPENERPAALDRMLRTLAAAYTNLMRAYQLDSDAEDSDDRVADLIED